MQVHTGPESDRQSQQHPDFDVRPDDDFPVSGVSPDEQGPHTDDEPGDGSCDHSSADRPREPSPDGSAAQCEQVEPVVDTFAVGQPCREGDHGDQRAQELVHSRRVGGRGHWRPSPCRCGRCCGGARGLLLVGERFQVDVPTYQDDRGAVGDPVPSPGHPKLGTMWAAQGPLQHDPFRGYPSGLTMAASCPASCPHVRDFRRSDATPDNPVRHQDHQLKA